MFRLVKEERPSLTDEKQRFDTQKYPAMAYIELFKALNKMVKVVPNCELGSEGIKSYLNYIKVCK
jgi:chromosome condensin MukBEF ATPase and DNA-binding subunit MukB